MAVIHQTTLTPGKLTLLEAWLPSQPWYEAAGAAPQLARAGGFRLDDPAGEVGIEFMVVTDQSGGQPASYHVPLTYRGAPLAGAGHALVGEAEHGVLGRRWIYDGVHDPVLMAQLAGLLEGTAQAQAQSVSDTPDASVVRYLAEADLAEADIRVIRRLQPSQQEFSPGSSHGYVEAGWVMPDGAAVRGLVVLVASTTAAPVSETRGW